MHDSLGRRPSPRRAPHPGIEWVERRRGGGSSLAPQPGMAWVESSNSKPHLAATRSPHPGTARVERRGWVGHGEARRVADKRTFRRPRATAPPPHAWTALGEQRYAMRGAPIAAREIRLHQSVAHSTCQSTRASFHNFGVHPRWPLDPLVRRSLRYCHAAQAQQNQFERPRWSLIRPASRVRLFAFRIIECTRRVLDPIRAIADVAAARRCNCSYRRSR